MIFVLLWILLEIFHYIYSYVIYFFIRKKRYFYSKNNPKKMEKYIDSLTNPELIEFIENTIEDKYGYKIEYKSIPRENMVKWVSYMLYFNSMWQLSDEQLDNARGFLDFIERRINYNFTNGNDNNMYVVRFGNNKIMYNWKPFSYYCVIRLVKMYVYNTLNKHNYRLYISKNNICYFYKVNNSNPTYTIFYHGLGVGIIPYFNFLTKLESNTNIIFPILPNISNIECHSYFTYLTENTIFPNSSKWLEDINELIYAFKIPKLNLIGHSFGSIIVSSIVNNTTIDINKIIYIDPICFLDGCYKIYKYLNCPTKEYYGLIDYIVYKDLYTRYATQRYMYGPEFWIYSCKDVNSDKYIIILSEKDDIVPTDILKSRFDKYNVNYILLDNAQHGDIFIKDEYINSINLLKKVI